MKALNLIDDLLAELDSWDATLGNSKSLHDQNEHELDLSQYNDGYKFLRYIHENLATPESIAYGKRFKPMKNDILVITPPKSGTFWTGYIIHLLKCKCNMNAINQINENEDFMPFLLSCYDYEFLINNPNDEKNCYHPKYLPRLFMKHSLMNESYVNDKNCQIIVVMRDPKDILYSWYKRLSINQNTILNFDSFADSLAFNHGNLPQALTPFEFFNSWSLFYKNNNFQYKYSNVLTLFYEDLIENRQKCIQEIEIFLNINHPNDKKMYDFDLEKMVTHLSSFDEMIKIGDKLNFGRCTRYFIKRLEKRCNKGKMNVSEKQIYKFLKAGHVRSDGGKVGQSIDKIDKKWLKKIDEYWYANIFPKTQCKNYQQFRKKISFLYK